MGQTIHISLFARLRELLGRESISVSVPADGLTVTDLLSILKSDPALADRMGTMPVLAAVNQTMARAQDRVMPGDEVALFPPVTGG